MTEANPIDRIYSLTVGESIQLNADDYEYVTRKNYFVTEAYDTTSYTTVTHPDGSATITLIKSLTDDHDGSGWSKASNHIELETSGYEVSHEYIDGVGWMCVLTTEEDDVASWDLAADFVETEAVTV